MGVRIVVKKQIDFIENLPEWKKRYIKLKYFSNNSIDASNSNEDVDLIKLENIPLLYKYCSFDMCRYSLQNLEKNQIRLNNPNNFNDPFDSMFSVDVLKMIGNSMNDILDKAEINNIIPVGYKEKFIDNAEFLEGLEKLRTVQYMEINNSKRDSLRVTCFSEVNDSILMWSHYAANHKGFCIEYDFTNTNKTYYTGPLNPVIYTDKLFDLTEYFKSSSLGKLFEFCSIVKSKEWQYEKEWRWLLNFSKGHEEHILKAPIPNSIYLGVNTTDENKDLILNIAKAKGIPVHQMEKKPFEFKLISNKL
jgi:hypothetical protein